MNSNDLIQMSNLFVAGNAVMRSIDAHYNLIFELGAQFKGFFASPQDFDSNLHGQHFEIYSARYDSVVGKSKTELSDLDRKTLDLLYVNEDFVAAIEHLSSEHVIKNVILTHNEDLYSGEDLVVAILPAREISPAAI